MATRLERRAGPVPDAEPASSRWRTLYRLGGAAALLSAVLIPAQVAVFIAWPPPTTVSGWFRLFQSNRLAALIDLDVLLVVDNVLLVVVLLALYLLLRQTNQAVMATATTLGLLGIALFITSNPAFEMLSLSDQYAGAATDAQRSAFLAAGEAMLASWQGTAFQVAYLLGSVAGIAIGAVMLRSGIFGRLTAWSAILGNAVAAFDTRFDKPRWLTGSAAVHIARRLQRTGHRVVVPPESFFVEHAGGPLREGEAGRARRWGERLAQRIALAPAEVVPAR